MASDLNILNASQVARILDDGGPRHGDLQGRLDLVPGGGIAIRDGKIAAVAATAAILREFPDPVPTLDATGMSVLPGLVECHSHPIFAGNRHWEYVRRLQGATSRQIRAEGAASGPPSSPPGKPTTLPWSARRRAVTRRFWPEASRPWKSSRAMA